MGGFMNDSSPVKPSRDRIRVLIVEDAYVVRSALSAALLCDDDLQLVAEAENGEQAVQLCGRVQPDLVLMDLVMPVMNGIEATRIIRSRWPQTRVIALTSIGHEDLAGQALEAGAISCLFKAISADDLLRALHSLACSCLAGPSDPAPRAALNMPRASAL